MTPHTMAEPSFAEKNNPVPPRSVFWMRLGAWALVTVWAWFALLFPEWCRPIADSTHRVPILLMAEAGWFCTMWKCFWEYVEWLDEEQE